MGYKETLTGENASKRNTDGILSAQVPAVAQAATDFTILGVAPFKGRIVSAKFIPKTALTGADTDTRIHRVYNRKGDASGTAIMASLQYNNGVNAPAKREKTITLSVTEANLLVEAGDVIEWNSAAVGLGIADIAGRVEVRLERD